MGYVIAFVAFTVVALQIFDMLFGNWCAAQATEADEREAKRLAYLWRGLDFIFAAILIGAFWTQVYWRGTGVAVTVIALVYTSYLVYGPLASLLTIKMGDQTRYFRAIRQSRFSK